MIFVIYRGEALKRSFYIYNDGMIQRKDNTIRFINNLGNKKDIPIENINDLYVMSEMNFNTSLINLVAKYGITVHFFNYYSFYTGSFYPREQLLSGSLLVKQVEYYSDYEKRLELAKKFIEAAADNIYRNLRYYNSRGKDLKEEMSLIDNFRKSIPLSKNINQLMGYEGNIRKVYYEAWNTIINEEINFKKRVMHPPDNMINTLISFVNSIIYTKVLSEVYMTQLNPTISYLHEPSERRFSLCLDIAEIFKPIIGDRLIFSLLNKRQITEKSFTRGLNKIHLTKEASSLILREIDSKLETTIKHKELNKVVTYKYLIRLECYKLVKHLLEEKKYEGFKIWW